MSESPDRLARRLRVLREEFDRSFARPFAPAQQRQNEILCFTAEGARFAAPSASLELLAKAGAIVPVPSRAPGLLGITVIRARLMPVYSLARLTGRAAQASNPFWIAVLRGPAPAAVAIDALEGYAERESVAEAGADPEHYTAGSVRHQDQLYALLDCERLVGAITQPAEIRKGLEATT